MKPLSLRVVDADVFSVHAAHGSHVGNLKRVGTVWKFKAMGYEADGSVVPGGGPLTAQHNTVFAAPDEHTINLQLG